MSGQATGWVLRFGPRHRALRAVLVTIADGANRDGRHSHPGLQAMIEGSLYSRTYVFKMIDQLIDDGWIVITEPGGGRGKATTYDIPGVLEAPFGYAENSPLCGPLSATETVHSAPGNRPLSRGNSPLDPPPTRGDASPTVCSTEENNEDPSRAQPPLPLDVPPEIPEALSFQPFWDAWPKRNGRKLARRQAERIWNRLTPEERALALRGAYNYADASWRRKAGAMDAFRWLEKRLWDDWQEPLPPDSDGRMSPPPMPPARQQVTADRSVSGRWTPTARR